MNKSFPGWRVLELEFRKKAFVLEHKKVLFSDPSVKAMNPVMWDFEYACFLESEERKAEVQVAKYKMIKSSVIQLLGLNLLPVQDDVTGKLRLPNDGEAVPLSILIANETSLTEMEKKLEQYLQEQEVLEGAGESGERREATQDVTPDEFDEMMKGLDFKDSGFNLEWDSVEAKALRERSITTVEPDMVFDEDTGEFPGSEFRGSTSTVVNLEDE